MSEFIILYMIPLLICLLMVKFAINIITDEYIALGCLAAIIPITNIFMIFIISAIWFHNRIDNFNEFIKHIIKR